MRMRFTFSALIAVLTLAGCSSVLEPTPASAPSQQTRAPVASDANKTLEPIDRRQRYIDQVQARAPLVRAPAQVEQLCQQIGDKLGSVDASECQSMQMASIGHSSVQGRVMAARDYLPAPDTEPLGRVLVIGGIHGDEYASVSVLFKWMALLERESGSAHSAMSDQLYWRFMPLTNPDGLLRKESQRTNHRGVDLNRNFPSADWPALAQKYWREKSYSNARRYPGAQAASEPETRALIEQIERFKPDVIVSVHAPYHLLDFDGPSEAPERIGELYLHQLGVYPGSLGNYGGIDLKLPVVTLELPSAGIMPTQEHLHSMWHDLNKWLIQERSARLAQAR